jgi:hypothetical protein
MEGREIKNGDRLVQLFLKTSIKGCKAVIEAVLIELFVIGFEYDVNTGKGDLFVKDLKGGDKLIYFTPGKKIDCIYRLYSE